MDNLNFDLPLGFGMKSLVEGRDHHLGSISQIWHSGDLSDDIPALANVAIGKINQTNPGVV
jgi:hypothetical protein